MHGKTNKIKSPIVTIVTLLLVGVVSLFRFTIPVFASDYTIQGNQITFTFYVDASTDINVDSNTDIVYVRIPLYVSISPTNNGDWERFRYLSGAVSLGSGNSPVGNLIPSIDGVAGNFSHFEPSYGYGVSLGRVDSSSNVATMVYFDNYLIDTTSTSMRKLIGYMVYSAQCSDGVANVRFSTSNYSVTPSSTTTLRYTDYESGFVQAIVYALNNCQSVDDIVDILNNIDVNSGYLPDIFTDIHTYFPQFFNYLGRIMYSNENIETYIVYIYNILNDAYTNEMNYIDQQAGQAENQLQGLAHDIELTKPSAVADIADSYITQIDTTYNNGIFGFMSNATLILMLCIVFAFAVLSYLLYGGQ